MHAIRRSCRTALLDTAQFARPASSSRAFSRSAPFARGALPVFLEASSPALSQLLSTLNARVLLPRHLTSEQEKLVYRQENRTRLEQEPIDITLGDVTLSLEHLDRNKDIPAYKAHFRNILKASQTTADWENVVRAIEGYANAGLHLDSEQMSMAVRLLNKAGQQHLVLKLVQRADLTELRLRDLHLIWTVLRGIRDKAWQAGWEKEDLKKALSLAEQTVVLMEDSAHKAKTPRRTVDGQKLDYSTHPTVVAVPLEMAGELAYRHEGDAAKVKLYASRLMAALKQHEFLAADMQRIAEAAQKTDADFASRHQQLSALAALHNDLTSLIPVWNALSTARTVLDAEMPMPTEAERVQRELRDLLEKGVEAADRLRIRNSKKLASDSAEGYVGYINSAIRACEEDEE